MPRKDATSRDEVIRAFWALFLDSQVANDGQVKGFEEAWSRMSHDERGLAERFANACWIKIDRDRRDAEDCIAAGVAAFRHELAMLPMRSQEPRVSPSRAVWLMAVWRTFAQLPVIPPPQVAADLIERIPGDKPIDLSVMLERLRAWPPSDPYPLLPDDDALTLRLYRRAMFDNAAWTPGSVPGPWRQTLLAGQELTASGGINTAALQTREPIDTQEPDQMV